MRERRATQAVVPAQNLVVSIHARDWKGPRLVTGAGRLTNFVDHVDSDRRRLFVAAAGSCLIVFVLLAGLVHLAWSPLQAVDSDVGAPAEAWSLQHVVAVRVLLAIETVFGTLGTVLYVSVLLIVLWLHEHRRAVVWSASVMVGTSVTTTASKLLFRRQRPQWDDSVHTLTSYSFPSGHASGIASGMGVLIVLVTLYVHRTSVRRAILAAAAVLVVMVGADRILLGVHNLSDVVAGYAVAGIWVYSMLALYPPEVARRIPRMIDS
ncbi:phosphatase PAP2 family protein [Nocardioides zhouii]|uniref:Phosphatase PAP2 family protein n=1 Tax=Nocardioides zhouii TaxID=1168729 RepID=A0A4Q2SYG5_9ACTN|nr:phosphatase PAP2 family protein [Nocardioides zhouii]RYC10521.1 phosphatase PAP2 family protein [Nocardioides zhouii]